MTNVTVKKRFINAMTTHGAVYHAAQAARVSRQTAYRWRHEDSDFADQWEEAFENAVDAVENTIYQQAVGGNTLAAIFYLKAHRGRHTAKLSLRFSVANDRRGQAHSIRQVVGFLLESDRWVAGIFLSHEWFPKFAPWILAARLGRWPEKIGDDELSNEEFDELVRMNRELREGKQV